MSEITLLTINISKEALRWSRRRWLIVDQIADLNPDLIALQEVSLKGRTSSAHWLARELNDRKGADDDLYNLYLCPRTGSKQSEEALAILSRLPVRRHEQLDLQTQNRVAQLVKVRLDGELLIIVNCLLYQKPGPADERRKQVDLLLDWLDTQPAEIPVVVCGSFNCEPSSPTIDMMRQYFDSAHRAVHNEEPAFTFPTPLLTSRELPLQRIMDFVFRNREKAAPIPQKTVDYIFVDPRLHTQDCRVVLDLPADDHPGLYPSTHLGLIALIKVN